MRFLRWLTLARIVLVFPALAVNAAAAPPYEEDALASARRSLVAARDRPLLVTGSVTDFEGNPLSGVTISALVARYEPDRIDDPFLASESVTTATDGEGRFTINAPAAQFLDLLPPFKEGYEFRPEWSAGVRFEDHAESGRWATLQPDAAPVALTMRKRGAGTYLLTFGEGYSDVTGERRLLGARLTPSDVTYVGSSPTGGTVRSAQGT